MYQECYESIGGIRISYSYSLGGYYDKPHISFAKLSNENIF